MTNKSAYLDEKVTASDVLHIAENMRAVDRQEIWDSHHALPLQALRLSTQLSSLSWAIRRPEFDLAVGVIGVCPNPSSPDCGTPWLLATNDFDEVGLRVLRESRDMVARMLEEHSFLENWVSACNLTHIKWLKWSGYELDDPAPFGAEQKLFFRFWKRR